MESAVALALPVVPSSVVPSTEIIVAAAPRTSRASVARVGLVVTVLALLVAVFAASLIGPFIMFVAPLILVMGSALGPLHAMMTGELSWLERREVRDGTP
jgi:hypothetical protein